MLTRLCIRTSSTWPYKLLGLACTDALPGPADGAARPLPPLGVAGASWLDLKLPPTAAERGVPVAPLLLDPLSLLMPPADGQLGPAAARLAPLPSTAGWLEAAVGTRRRCSGCLGSMGVSGSDGAEPGAPSAISLLPAPAAAAAEAPAAAACSVPPAAASPGASRGAAGSGTSSGSTAGRGGGLSTTTCTPAATLRPLWRRIWMKDGMAIWGAPSLQKLSLPAGWNSSTTRVRGRPWARGGPAGSGVVG